MDTSCLAHRRTREGFFELAYGAADAVACLGAAGLLWPPHHLASGAAGAAAAGAGAAAAGAGAAAPKAAAAAEEAEAEAVQARALCVWLGETLVAFDARLALGAAARRGDLVSMAHLLGGRAPTESGLELDEPAPGWPPTGLTCLHFAARAGQTAAVSWLLERGADPDARSCDGRRPLHAAAEYPLPAAAETAALLLSRGASVNLTDDARRSALQAAAITGHQAVAALLVASGADVLATDGEGYNALDHAHLTSGDLCCQVPGAEWGGVVSLLSTLRPMLPAKRCTTAQRAWDLVVSSSLQEAALRGDAAELSRLLGSYGHTQVGAKDWDGTTALHAAAQAGHAGAVSALLTLGADANDGDNYGDTPLHTALAEGAPCHLNVAELLLAHGAEAGAKNRFGRTAAEQAVVSAAGRANGGDAERPPPQRREKRVVISSGLVI